MNNEDIEIIYVPSRTPSPMVPDPASRSSSPMWLPLSSRTPSPMGSDRSVHVVESNGSPSSNDSASRSSLPAYSLSVDASNVAGANQQSPTSRPGPSSGSVPGSAPKRRRVDEPVVQQIRRIVLPDCPTTVSYLPHRLVVLPKESDYGNRPIGIILPIVRPSVRRMSNSSNASSSSYTSSVEQEQFVVSSPTGSPPPVSYE